MGKINLPQPVKEFVTSPKFLHSLYFIVFSLAMTIILASQNFLFQRVVENGISRKDIIAAKTIVVEDKKRTEQQRKEVAQRIEPIMTITEDDFIKNNLSSLQNSILKIREKDTSQETKREEVQRKFKMAYLPISSSFINDSLL